jgi:hypothetical protein
VLPQKLICAAKNQHEKNEMKFKRFVHQNIWKLYQGRITKKIFASPENMLWPEVTLPSPQMISKYI